MTPQEAPLQLSNAEIMNLAAVDTAFFSKKFFPKTVRQDFSPQHLMMFEALDDASKRYVEFLCHRGMGKTSITRLFIAKRVSYAVSRTIFLLSASEDHSVRSVKWLKARMETNKLWTQFYGLERGGTWRDDQIEIYHSIADVRITILGKGMTGSIRGVNFDDYRPDLILLDDVLTDENTATEDQRDKTHSLVNGAVLQSLAPVVDEPNAKLVMSQTPMHPDDVSMQAVKAEAWHTLQFPCWSPETLELPAEEQESAWPERFPTEELRRQKRDAIAQNKYSVFAREMELKLIGSEKKAFKRFWVQFHDEPPLRGPKVLAIDPVPPPTEHQIAKGLKGKDFEAQAVVTRAGGKYALLDYAVNRGHEPSWSVAKAFELAIKWRVSLIVVETVAYQRVLKTLIEQEMRRRGQFFPILPYVDKRSKYNRITAALTGITQQGLFTCSPEHTTFLQQFEDYPDGARDLLDAVAIGLDNLVVPELEGEDGGGGDDWYDDDSYGDLEARGVAP